MVPLEVVRLALLGTMVLPFLDMAPLEVVRLALLDVHTLFIFLPDLAFKSSKHRCSFSAPSIRARLAELL
jgi:hypothetical protein